MSEIKFSLSKKSLNCVDEAADSFGYSSFGEGNTRAGSISFFKEVIEWPEDIEYFKDGDVPTAVVKYNIATIKMPEEALLALANFIIEQNKQYLEQDEIE